MLLMGHPVNVKKITHEFYIEKIFEEKQRQAEENAKKQAKAMNDAKMAEMGIGKTGAWECSNQDYLTWF